MSIRQLQLRLKGTLLGVEVSLDLPGRVDLVEVPVGDLAILPSGYNDWCRGNHIERVDTLLVIDNSTPPIRWM
jgi:hypothetical protein